MDRFPLDLQVRISWVCKKLFLIRHKNLSGPDFTPRQLPGNRRHRLDDGPVPTLNGVQAHFRSFFFGRLFTSCTFGSFPTNLQRSHGRHLRYFLVGLWASLTRYSRVRLRSLSDPLLLFNPIFGLLTSIPPHTISVFHALRCPSLSARLRGSFAIIYLVHLLRGERWRKALRFSRAPYPLRSPTRGC